jgi:hypothetical protein
VKGFATFGGATLVSRADIGVSIRLIETLAYLVNIGVSAVLFPSHVIQRVRSRERREMLGQVARLNRRGIPALGIDRSATAIRLAGRGGALALLGDVFAPLPGTGRWRTVLLVDGNVGLGGDPRRILARAAELLARGGRCVVEFDTEVFGVRPRWVRLESAREVGPWFRWASVGVDSAGTLAAQVGLTLTGVRLIGGRVIAIMAAL